MNEAPAATRDVPDDRNDLLPILLLSDIGPPFRGVLFACTFQLAYRNQKKGIKSSEQWLGLRDELERRHGEAVAYA